MDGRQSRAAGGAPSPHRGHGRRRSARCVPRRQPRRGLACAVIGIQRPQQHETTGALTVSSCLNIGAEVRCSELKCPCYRPLFVENRARSSSWMSNTSWTCHRSWPPGYGYWTPGRSTTTTTMTPARSRSPRCSARVVPELVAEDQTMMMRAWAHPMIVDRRPGFTPFPRGVDPYRTVQLANRPVIARRVSLSRATFPCRATTRQRGRAITRQRAPGG